LNLAIRVRLINEKGGSNGLFCASARRQGRIVQGPRGVETMISVVIGQTGESKGFGPSRSWDGSVMWGVPCGGSPLFLFCINLISNKKSV
jgi:hypothetical protein